MIVLRALGPTEKRITLMGVAMLMALAVNGVLMLFDFRIPAPLDLLALAAIGLCTGAGHILIMAALRAAPANRIAPAQYSQMIWAVLLGAIFFERVSRCDGAGRDRAGLLRRAFHLRPRGEDGGPLAGGLDDRVGPPAKRRPLGRRHRYRFANRAETLAFAGGRRRDMLAKALIRE